MNWNREVRSTVAYGVIAIVFLVAVTVIRLAV